MANAESTGNAQMTFSAEFMSVLACPNCRSGLAIDYEASELVCVNQDCRLAYPVRNGIPILLVDQARKS